ncbi:valine--tRNA ligase, partial [Candidatus Woesearchaeota archaeon]|nr:valine--tRNA ligase [Candidatus Woesearchaeota archaeon]
DDNGLPTERLVEKEKKVRAKDFTRDEFRLLCLDYVNETKPEFIADWVRLGMSCDFSISYSTIDPHCQKTGQKSFLDLYKKGLLSRKETPVAWCPACQTAIAQAEFENIDMTSHFSDIIFKEGGKDHVIATTRPELLPACVALAYHPSDKRYKDCKGKFAKVPLFDYDVPFIADEDADPEKGTGLMMVCTFGDKEDIEKWYKHKLPLKVVLTKDGRMNEHAPGYEGLKIKEARVKIIEALKEKKLLIRQEEITHAVNVHERCATPIEFLKTPQWFISLLDKKEELLEAADKINWYPEHMKVRYLHWVENLNWEWCISRQRYYGVPFPVWYTKDGEIVVADEKDLPVDPMTSMPKGKKDLTPEEDVFDTWMISSVSPQIALDWVGDKKDEMKRLYPMSMRPQAHDIIRTWAFYTIVKGIYHHKQVPWKDIVISGHVLDPKGNKMSKSRGNVVNPQDVIEKYSADALRFWAAGVKLGDDLPYMEKDIQTGQKTVTKLWNAMKFSIMHLEDYQGFEGEVAVLDRWLLSKFNKIVKDCTENFDKYEYSKTKLEAEKFFWQVFCDNYLELVKDRLYEPEKYGEDTLSAKHTLYSVSVGILKLFAPIMPHITEELYQLYYRSVDGKRSIHTSEWPVYREELDDEEAEAVGDEVIKIVAAVRKFKSEKQLSMKAPLKKLKITTKLNLAVVETDILAVTHAETLEHKKGAFSIEIVE